MSNLPNKLRLKNGALEMIDGSDVAEYLKNTRIPDGADVVVLTRESAERLVSDAQAYRMLMDVRFALAA